MRPGRHAPADTTHSTQRKERTIQIPTITPSIEVTIGRETRLYHAFITNAPTTLDAPATVTLHTAPLDTVRFPTDAKVAIAVRTRAQYGAMPQARLRFILAELEIAARTPFDPPCGQLDAMWIEHVLPDAWAEHWLLLSGSHAPPDFMVPADDPRHSEIGVRQVLKHSLGNLTPLTSSGNQRLGNLPYATEDPNFKISKREALGSSLLKMNVEIAASDSWDEEDIRLRAEQLAGRVIALWPGPTVQ